MLSNILVVTSFCLKSPVCFYSHFVWNFQEVLMKDSQDLLRTEVVFVRYGTQSGKERSGAYLFLPNGEAEVGHLLVHVPVLLILTLK